MTAYRFLSSSTLPPKFAAACATALGLATISLFAGTPNVQHNAAAPSYENIVVLPTIVVVPDAADRAAAAALQTAGVAAAKRLDEV
ncbi:hypothetical protein [Tahibacter harae]|uniref:Uncharacterized protein n=1 Tax=Tahibacter harae TaxID=2963937 RepID=A0ABT1QMC2_9GAMM|nr:hypothetical protein [Tahibacter harae]MCQ4163669.1 hypothetical protein [Tahibacter harae]